MRVNLKKLMGMDRIVNFTQTH